MSQMVGLSTGALHDILSSAWVRDVQVSSGLSSLQFFSFLLFHILCSSSSHPLGQLNPSALCHSVAHVISYIHLNPLIFPHSSFIKIIHLPESNSCFYSMHLFYQSLFHYIVFWLPYTHYCPVKISNPTFQEIS